MFLWLVSNIKVSVTASDVMEKCRTDVFVSVFYDTRDSMDFVHNEEGRRGSAVSLYFLEIPHFTLVGERKGLKSNVKSIYSAPPKLCIFVVSNVSYVPLYTMFLP